MYKYTLYNKDTLTQHELCACCFCLSEFKVSKIIDWIDDGKTALCPYCWVDVIVVSTKCTNLYNDADIIGYFEKDGIITYRDDDGRGIL